MAGYWVNSAQGTEAVITTTITAAAGQLINIWETTALLTTSFINEFDVGASGPPNATDCSIIYEVTTTTTAAPTGGTSATARPDNQAARASGATAMVNATGGNTLGNIMFHIGLNQRASYRWTAIPGYEIVVPATNLVGMVLGAKSATYASTIGSSLHFFE